MADGVCLCCTYKARQKTGPKTGLRRQRRVHPKSATSEQIEAAEKALANRTAQLSKAVLFGSANDIELQHMRFVRAKVYYQRLHQGVR